VLPIYQSQTAIKFSREGLLAINYELLKNPFLNSKSIRENLQIVAVAKFLRKNMMT